jgi:pilus assembly protein Flp/PilA
MPSQVLTHKHTERESNMKQISKILVAMHRDETGQDLIEYALVAALIAFAAVAGMNYVASELNNAFSKIGNKLSNAIS